MSLKNLEEYEFIESIRSGDQTAFRTLYILYREDLYIWIFKFLKTHELSQEVLQDVFLKIWLNRRRIDPERNIKSFIYSVSKNTIIDYLRKISLDKSLVESITYEIHSKSTHADSNINYREVESHLSELLNRLPEKCRKVYILCKIEGRSHKEVSEILKISPSTINNQIVKASKFVKENWNYHYLFFFIFFLDK